jgi:hypothetical protein
MKIPCWNKNCNGLGVLMYEDGWFRVNCSTCNSGSNVCRNWDKSLEDWYCDYDFQKASLEKIIIIQEKPL